jgi:hypothetical protein
MELIDIKVIEEKTIKTPVNRSPIWYANISYNIVKRVRKKDLINSYIAKKVVCKGTLHEIKNSQEVKKIIVKNFYGNDKKNFDKMQAFDLSTIQIKKIELILFLGYGIKQK